MDNDFLQKSLSSIVKAERAERFGQSEQLSLGELISKLEALLPNQEAIKKKYEHEASVSFDFEYAIPTGLSSWRGIYAELAITFDFIGYEHFNKEKPEEMPISKFVTMLKSAIGKSYTGWKGGDFIMGKTTPLWVANDGNAGNTAVVGIQDNEYEIILLTKYINS
jgi:hypothetical protein